MASGGPCLNPAKRSSFTHPSGRSGWAMTLWFPAQQQFASSLQLALMNHPQSAANVSLRPGKSVVWTQATRSKKVQGNAETKASKRSRFSPTRIDEPEIGQLTSSQASFVKTVAGCLSTTLELLGVSQTHWQACIRQGVVKFDEEWQAFGRNLQKLRQSTNNPT